MKSKKAETLASVEAGFEYIRNQTNPDIPERENVTKILYFGIGDTKAVNVTTVLAPLSEASEAFFEKLDTWKYDTYYEIIKVKETEKGYVFETEPWNAESDTTVFALTFAGEYSEDWLIQIAFEFSRFCSKIA